MHIRVKAKWNGEPFDKIFEVEDEADCIEHVHFWASVAEATITDIEMEEAPAP